MSGNTRPEPISYGAHFVDADDIAAVVRVLEGDRLTQGEAVRRFEADLGRITGARHAVAVANGTLALHLAYLALDVDRRTRVVTTANTFLATATAALHCGARVSFLDIDPHTGNLDPDRLEELCESGAVPNVVTAVHFAGLPCPMQRLIDLKRRHGFRLVEDAAHALGARYTADGHVWRVGENPAVDATVLSFHPVKHVTTGEGGAVLCHDDLVARRLRRLRDHGREPARGSSTDVPMVELGLNGRMSELHAALGESQLKKLPDFAAARREIAMRYLAELNGFELLDAGGPGGSGTEHAWHLFVLRVRERDELFAHLRENGIRAQVHYRPVPMQPYFRERLGAGDWPHAVRHGREALSLPIYPALSEADQERVIRTLCDWRRGRVAA